jgi:hypothetical protein
MSPRPSQLRCTEGGFCVPRRYQVTGYRTGIWQVRCEKCQRALPGKYASGGAEPARAPEQTSRSG